MRHLSVLVAFLFAPQRAAEDVIDYSGIWQVSTLTVTGLHIRRERLSTQLNPNMWTSLRMSAQLSSTQTTDASSTRARPPPAPHSRLGGGRYAV